MNDHLAKFLIDLPELKGNIRVFCRVRPVLGSSDRVVVSPTSTELRGHGLVIVHNGNKVLLCS